jgi:hypothetical protein
MAEYPVTIEAADLQDLFQGDDGVKVLMEKVLNPVLQVQANEQLQAGPDERPADRQGYRNGIRARKLTTRVGMLTLRIPPLRAGQFSTDLFAATGGVRQRGGWPRWRWVSMASPPGGSRRSPKSAAAASSARARCQGSENAGTPL